MSAGLLLVVFAVVPGLLLLWYFHTRDASPIPPRRLWATFGWGCACTVPALVAGLTTDGLVPEGARVGRAAFTAFVQAGLFEEAAKLAVLLFYSLRARYHADPMDGLVYGAAASLGFATLENVLYVADGGMGVAVVRALLSVPGHAFYGAILGYYVGQARLRGGADPAPRGGQSPLAFLLTGFVLAATLHGLYDFGLFAAPLFKNAPGMLVLCLCVTLAAFGTAWRLTLLYVRRLRRGQAVAAPTPLTNSLAAPFAPGAPANPQRSGRDAALKWLFLALGGLAISFGGLFTLVAAAAPFLADAETPAGSILGGGLLLGLPPLLVGLWLFRKGIRR